ncbi:MAG: hypothetical protein ABEJ28_07280 [Salinigranum sp.]
MALPKGKLFALLAVFAAIGIVTATGAFTTVTAARTATVNVAGDSQALLQLQAVNGANGNDPGTPVSGSGFSGAGPYVEEQANGKLQINLENVNVDAYTTAENAFTIANHGTQPVAIYIEKDGANKGAIDFGVNRNDVADPNGDTPSGNLGENDQNSVNIDSSGDAVMLKPGQSITVGLFIDTSDKDPSNGIHTAQEGLPKNSEILSGITIHARAASENDANGNAPWSYQIGSGTTGDNGGNNGNVDPVGEGGDGEGTQKASP